MEYIQDIDAFVKNKTVTNIFKQTDTDLILKFDDGTFVTMTASSDCCGDAWWNHFDGVDCLLNAQVISVEEVAGTPRTGEEEPMRQEAIEIHFLKITTNKGSVTIELRNESNRYYGGSVNYTTGLPFRWVFNGKKNVAVPTKEEELIVITEDF